MSWGPGDWEALGVMIQAAATGSAALGAAFTYRRSKRSDSLRWTDDHLRATLLNPEATLVRTDLEFRYLATLEGFVAAQLAGESPEVLSEAEIEAGARLDSFLIALEHVLVLRDQGVIRAADLDADFTYWTRDLLNRPAFASLRLYLSEFGFRRLAAGVQREDPRLLAAYGTLRDSSATLGDFARPEMTTVRRRVRVPGVLYDAGDYPAAVVDRAAIHGRAPITSTFEVDVMTLVGDDVASAWQDLDNYEEVDRFGSDGLYRRLFVPVGGKGAWVYHWIRPVEGLPVVDDGVWSV